MMDELEPKHAALGNIRKMLKDGQAKRLSGLVAKPTAVEVHVIKSGTPDEEGSPAEEKAEPAAEAATEGDAPNPVHESVMKLMDKLLRPKKKG